MDTIIYFMGGGGDPLAVRVEGSPDHIAEQRTRASGQPFPLKHHRGPTIYVNPDAMAYWREERGQSASEAPAVRRRGETTL